MSPFGSGSAFTGQTMQPLQPRKQFRSSQVLVGLTNESAAEFTSFNPNAGSQFNALAAPPAPPLPQQAPKDNSPANIFASMKSGTFENDGAQNNTGPRPGGKSQHKLPPWWITAELPCSRHVRRSSSRSCSGPTHRLGWTDLHGIPAVTQTDDLSFR